MKQHHKPSSPPGWLNKFLIWFCDDDRSEEIEGDLYEEYQEQYSSHGKSRANRHYFFSVLKFIKPRFSQKLSNTQDYVPRFGNYLKVSLRNFSKHKLVSSINIFGFAIGLAVMVLAGEYLIHQLSADRFVPNAERVYRVVWGYRSQVYSSLSFKESTRLGQREMINALKQIPEVEAAAQFTTSNSAIMGREFFATANDKRMSEKEVLFTNTPEAFQDIFDWPVLAGSLKGELFGQVMLTKSTAKRFFGEDWQTSSIGQPIQLGEANYLIKAVVADVPESAHLSFNMVAMVDSIPYTWGAYTYTRLKEFDDLKAMEYKVTEAARSINLTERDDPLQKGMFLQPLTDIHLGSDHLYELESNVNPTYVYLFAMIGLIMLVITCTNYINLTIAMYANRLKEIGVRKVIGARRKDIRLQFLFESIFITLLALPLALALVYGTLPHFNAMMNVQLSLNLLLSGTHLMVLFMLTITIGLFCGLYPAGLLAREPLLFLLKNQKGGSGARQLSLRKTLIGFQFLLLMILSGFAFYVNRQLTYVNEKELGFDKEGVLSFGFSGAERYAILKQKLLANPNILEVGSGGLPGNEPFNTVTYRFEGVDQVFDDGSQLYMDLGAARALGLWSDAFEDLKEGKDRVMVMNETAVRKYEQISGEPRENLVGKMLIESPYDRQDDGTVGYPAQVNGFIKDFHYFTLREEHSPLFLTVYNEMSWLYNVQVKVNKAAQGETLDFIEQAYKELESDRPFTAVFLEDRLKQLYDAEDRIAGLVVALSYLSVMLAFSGLIGLTYYMAQQRQHEIAIRKVLGARVSVLLALMSREFLVMALWASVIAIPITIYLVNYWLSSFAFHVTPNVLNLIVLGGLGIAIMMVGVVSQSVQVVRNSPVDALKQER